uniref:LRRCT domain-containing protein n=1 Tax=Branchiostoma floridae TaxID=7739 RepID=C3ZQX9_BRAFL|eukprot:XP_002589009.1 hypothetical protein BRAFLDRAFT_87481 [Branchiostoma floridae]
MLFLLLLAAACGDPNGPSVPQCKTAGWRECVPVTPRTGILMYGTSACVMCKVLNVRVASGGPFSFLARANSVAIKAYPFHVLSAKKLAPLQHSVLYTLALIDANITDVENNTFVGFPSLDKLSLDSNRLTNIKQGWFTGLENLLTLILSNNNIEGIEPGSFVHLRSLSILDLENNLLQVVHPAWLFGPTLVQILNLGYNEIGSISPGSFQPVQLTWLDLMGNDLSSLDGDVLGGQSSLSRLHISSGMLASVHDAKPHGILWTLQRFVRFGSWSAIGRGSATGRRSATLVVAVPKFIFCARYTAYELSLGWTFDSSDIVPGTTELGAVNPGISCGTLDRSLSTISIKAPAVVLATVGSLADRLVPNTLEQCRQVWEYDGGIVVQVGPFGSSMFRLASLATGSTSTEDVALSFVQKQDKSTLTTPEFDSSQQNTTHTNLTHDNTKNITCIILTKDEHAKLFFTVPTVQRQTHTIETTYRTHIGNSSSLTPYSETTENDNTSSLQRQTTEKDSTTREPRDHSTLQGSTTPAADLEVLAVISVAVSAVVGLVLSVLIVLVWKMCSTRFIAEDGRAGDDAHIWTIPPGVAFPGLLRSASLPTRPIKVVSDDAVSCRSLPAVLDSIQPTYSEIPDGIAAAQRPLPGLPHVYSEIPDAPISGVVRSASLPVCTSGGGTDDVASCRSLPAVLLSIEPNYSQIPDNIAAAQRPLPALPRTYGEVPDHEAAAQRPLPAHKHTYSEIPDDESGPMPFYADAAKFSLHVVRNRRQNRRVSRENGVTYGSAEQTKAQSNLFYRNFPEIEGIRARRQLRTALVSQPADQSVSASVNATDVILSKVQDGTGPHHSFLKLPNTYWPWEIPGEGAPNTPRRASLSLVTPPNTYWPWEMPVGGARNKLPRRAPLPLSHHLTPTGHGRYQSGEPVTNYHGVRPSPLSHHLTPTGHGRCQSGEPVTHHGVRPSPLSHHLTPTGHGRYQSGEPVTNYHGVRPSPLSHHLTPTGHGRCQSGEPIPGEGTVNTPRRASLPLVTPPNTYWPWEIPGEGARNTQRRGPLHHVTPPNTYWPWEMPGKGAGNTPPRASLPQVTLPNTYWPWDIPGEGTCNTPRRAPLPLELPNTYWPWEIPGEGARNTPQRAPLPLVTPPNTYWPWEIPGEGARNTQRRASLPLVTLPNTYWPWEIPGEGARKTP